MIARNSKGRLITDKKTVSIKLRLEEDMAGTLKDMAKKLDVPVASIIRQGITMVLEELSKEDK